MVCHANCKSAGRKHLISGYFFICFPLFKFKCPKWINTNCAGDAWRVEWHATQIANVQDAMRFQGFSSFVSLSSSTNFPSELFGTVWTLLIAPLAWETHGVVGFLSIPQLTTISFNSPLFPPYCQSQCISVLDIWTVMYHQMLQPLLLQHSSWLLSPQTILLQGLSWWVHQGQICHLVCWLLKALWDPNWCTVTVCMLLLQFPQVDLAMSFSDLLAFLAGFAGLNGVFSNLSHVLPPVTNFHGLLHLAGPRVSQTQMTPGQDALLQFAWDYQLCLIGDENLRSFQCLCLGHLFVIMPCTLSVFFDILWLTWDLGRTAPVLCLISSQNLEPYLMDQQGQEHVLMHPASICTCTQQMLCLQWYSKVWILIF